MKKHKKYWNRFLNWILPGRRARLLSEIMKRDQETGLYDKPICCSQWDEFGRCACENTIAQQNLLNYYKKNDRNKEKD